MDFNSSDNNPVYDCPIITDGQNNLMDNFSYLVEGILLCIVGNVGIVINFLSSIIIITRKEIRNCFNILLVGLAAFDSFYLFGAILESFRKYFPALKTDLHVELFPKLLYPLHQTAIAGSIFMTVAIAFERYTAVHFPMNYNQALNDQRMMRQRVLKYFVPVTFLSFVFTIPKFFESQVEYADEGFFEDAHVYEDNITSVHSAVSNFARNTSMKPYISLTPLRTHPFYSLYNSWSRFIVLGVIPFCLLSFFNTKIYRDIMERKKRIMVNNLAKSPRPITEPTMVELKPLKITAEAVDKTTPNVPGCKIPTIQIVINEATSNIPQPSVSEGPSSSQSAKSLKKTHCSIKKARTTRKNGSQEMNVSENNEQACCIICPLKIKIPQNKKTSSTSLQVNDIPEITDAGITFSGNLQSPNYSNKQKKKDVRRKNEDSLALVFMIIILVFLVCHAPRIILDINELVNLKKSEYCAKIGAVPFSFWSILLLNVSHFLLVMNSSVNMIVYCLLGSRFRSEVRKIMDNFVCQWPKTAPSIS